MLSITRQVIVTCRLSALFALVEAVYGANMCAITPAVATKRTQLRRMSPSLRHHGVHTFRHGV
jgi:hypothetical protein